MSQVWCYERAGCNATDVADYNATNVVEENECALRNFRMPCFSRITWTLGISVYPSDLNSRMQHYSTFWASTQKNAVALLQIESPDATLQHFLHLDTQKSAVGLLRSESLETTVQHFLHLACHLVCKNHRISKGVAQISTSWISSYHQKRWTPMPTTQMLLASWWSLKC